METVKIDHLLRKIAEDNCQQSFRQLFDIYYPRLFEIAKYYVRINHLAEEVIADVFIKLWKNRSSIDGIQNLRNYFFIAVKRQSLNSLRNNSPNLFYIDSLEHEMIVETRDPESDFFEKEYLEYISHRIQKLPEKCRLIFKLVKEDQLRYKEVADITGLSIKTVEMHVSNALKQLRIDIKRYKNYHEISRLNNL